MQKRLGSRILPILFVLIGAVGFVLGSATATPITSAPTAATPTPTIHTVRGGESLSLIAAEYAITVKQIVEANGLQDRDMIRIGQQLIIPAGLGSPVIAETPSPAIREVQPATPRHLLACPQNTDTYPLDLPTEAIRMAISDGQIFLIADGDLYTMPMPRSRHGTRLSLQNLVPPGRRVEGYSIRELVYVASDPATGDLLLLDKTNDVYRYTADGKWQMESLATQIPGQFPDPQFLAIQPADGHVYALDADLQHIWQLSDGAPQSHLARSGLNDAVDMAVSLSNSGPIFTVLTRNGTVAQHQAGAASRILGQFQPSSDTWPSQILARNDDLYVADGEARTVRRQETSKDQLAQVIEFRVPDMGLLRSIDVVGQTLYALAGSNLYRLQLDGQVDGNCPTVAYKGDQRFYGADLLNSLANVQLPFADVTLRLRPRSYPGARRLYRQGIHRGLDIYGLEAPGLRIGSPVRAIADGEVMRVDTDYVEMTPVEYEAAIARTLSEHRTPPALMEQFQGRQVRIDHGNGVESWYSHLESIAPGLAVGDTVVQGAPIGTVGVSGTSSGAYNSSGGAHLHLEIWIDGRYLGHGLSLYETMRLWQAIFEPSSIRTSATPAATSTPTVTPTVTPTPSPTAIPPISTTPSSVHACQHPPDEYSLATIRGGR